MKLKGSEAIVKVLLEQGVDTVFGYPGGAVIPLYDALYSAPLKNVLTAHEQGAIHAADGYARASGKTGVCIATSGPGATNIVTGLATAYLDSIPLVAITGQVGVSMLGRDSFQEIDIVGVTMPITKYNMMVRSKEELVPALREAFALAKEGRPGPVLVDVPSSVQVEELEWPEAEGQAEAEPLPQATAEQLTQAAEVLNAAQKPVLLVGGGAVNSGAQAELVELAEKCDLPVVNTLMGIGVYPESDARSLGLTGMHGHIASNLAVANADVLIVAGSRFSDRVTGDRNRYVGKKTIIQLDIDPSEIDKNVAASLPVMGDVKETLQRLLPLLREAQRLGITVNRIDETLGAFRHTRAELMEYAALCRDNGVALTVSIGPRAAYDTSATRLSRQGAVIGYRLRGEEQLVRALEDAKRVCDLGIRGLLVYDEGLLWVLNEARRAGELPADTVLKASAHCGHGNGASFRLLERCGADSINPVRDLSLDMLCALRASVSVPLDIHTDCPESSGGFIRTYEAPEIVRCCAPVYLKTGNSALAAHGSLPTEADAARMAQQAAIVMEMLGRYLPEARQLSRGEGHGQVAEAEVCV